MSADEEPEIKSVYPSYYSLMIVGKLDGIYDAWDQNLYSKAMHRALKLIPFLPPRIKKRIQAEKQRIQQALLNTQKVIGYSYASTARLSQRATDRIAYDTIESFVDKLTDLLDEAHLLTESYGVPTVSRGMKEFQLEVDLAKHKRGMR